METVDVIVVGSGQGGRPFAIERAKAGARVVLFERSHIGGTCVNNGCTPSKTFLASAHAAGRARRAAALGVHARVSIDFPAVMRRVRQVRREWVESAQRHLEEAGVRIVRAEARFTGERRVSGGGLELTADTIVIDVGGAPVIPKIDGLAGTPFLTNENVFELQTLPARLLVLGGGYVGLELGQGMARLGAEVTIVDRHEHVLDREDADVAHALEESLVEDGIALRRQREVTRVAHDCGKFAVTLDDGVALEAEALLVAIGRSSSAASLDPAAGGIALDDKGFIRVDERLRTSSPGVFAIGDAAGQPAFTHVAWEDHRRVAAILRGEQRTRADRPLAYSIFTEPQVARVGLSETEARKRGIQARSVTLPLSEVARAAEWGDERGFYRLVVDVKTDLILGATFVGYEAGELIHVILAHIEAGATWQVLERSVHVHPTYAEGLPSLARLLVSTQA